MITDLIPQREPILMVDDAHTLSKDSVCASLTIRSTNWFCQDNQLLEAGIIEHMAQSAATMIGLQGEGEPKVGYIGDVKDFIVFRLPRIGEQLSTEVRTTALLEDITIIEATTRIGDEVIASARIKIFIMG